MSNQTPATRSLDVEIKYGTREDGSMWLSIGDPAKGPHWQADWGFGEEWARYFADARTRIERLEGFQGELVIALTDHVCPPRSNCIHEDCRDNRELVERIKQAEAPR